MKLSFPREQAQTRIVFQGNTFTVAEAILDYEGRFIRAEGVSRRSSLDAPNPELGRFIAIGRSIKALEKKFRGERIRYTLMG